MEQVLVVRRDDFFPGGWPVGFQPYKPLAGNDLRAALEAKASFAPRDEAEQNPSWKQLIPYCAVTLGDAVFCVERLPSQGEARLHGKRSIGFGGHINPEDGPPAGAIERGLRRELREELALPIATTGATTFLGVLNDDSTEVGAVHLGLVYRLDLPPHTDPDRVKVRETRKMRGRFCDLATLRRDCDLPNDPAWVVESAQLWQDRGRFESWSAIMLEHNLWVQPEAHNGGSVSGDYERAEEPQDG